MYNCDMAQCTAPIQGHRTARGRANCPACSTVSYYPSTNRYPIYAPSSRTASMPTRTTISSPKRSFRVGTTVILSSQEYATLKPIHEESAKQAKNILTKEMFSSVMLGATEQKPPRNSMMH